MQPNETEDVAHIVSKEMSQIYISCFVTTSSLIAWGCWNKTGGGFGVGSARCLKGWSLFMVSLKTRPSGRLPTKWVMHSSPKMGYTGGSSPSSMMFFKTVPSPRMSSGWPLVVLTTPQSFGIFSAQDFFLMIKYMSTSLNTQQHSCFTANGHKSYHFTQ